MHHDHEPRRVSFPLLMALLLTLFLAGCALGNRQKAQPTRQADIQFAFHIDGTQSIGR
jgi:hypothetical protein